MNTPLIDEVGFKERFLAALGEQAPERADLLARHAWQVAVKNQVMNLTRIVDPKEMAIRHALDSLTAVPIFMNTEDFAVESALDLGTGAGWPGLALAIAIPHLNVTLLDARKKKIIFLEELVKTWGCPIESLASGRASRTTSAPSARTSTWSLLAPSAPSSAS